MSADTLAVPRYGDRSLTDLLPAVLQAVAPGRVPGLPTASLVFEPAQQGVVLLVDGLGWELLRRNAADAPFLTSLAESAPAPLTAGFPATTATSLASLGTGLPPGEHGVVGYEIAVPGEGWILNSLTMDERIDARAWQPRATLFERAATAGLLVTRVGRAAFAGSGLTEVALRGGDYLTAESAGETVAGVAAAARAAAVAGLPALTYCYHSDLDATGHRSGCDSDAWRHQLRHVDLLAEQLAHALPVGCTLWVTADHGMVDVAAGRRIDMAATPALRSGVALLAGEPRARHVHTVDGAAPDVGAAWRGVLADSALVLTREQAVAAGWFGPRVTPAARERIGDLVVLAVTDMSIVDSGRMTERALALVGMHGSATSAEQLVPLLEFRPAATPVHRHVFA